MNTKNSNRAIPIALNLDDGAPINPMFWCDRRREHPMLIPSSFTRRFAEVCETYGVKGKYSVIPFPCCMGRIDRQLAYVAPKELRAFLDIVRTRLRPRFDITPEILTHDLAYNISKDSFEHCMEDVRFARESNRVPAKIEYITLALRILKNAGIPATGVTSPWMTGAAREEEYAEAIGRSFWRLHRRKFSFYSLHIVGAGVKGRPAVAWRDGELGLTVVHVPWTTGDHFWKLQFIKSKPESRAAMRAAADTLLTQDGQKGRIQELVEAGAPVVLCTHWQSLFSDGRGTGLSCFEEVLKRIRRHLRHRVEWVTCSELARRAL